MSSRSNRSLHVPPSLAVALRLLQASATVAVLMLAAGLALGAPSIGSVGLSGSDNVTSRPHPWSGVWAKEQYVTYFLVDSDVQALSVERSIAHSAAEQIEVALNGRLDDGSLVGVDRYVINTDSYEGQLAAENLLAASSEIANQPGVSVTVVDLRSR